MSGFGALHDGAAEELADTLEQRADAAFPGQLPALRDAWEAKQAPKKLVSAWSAAVAAGDKGFKFNFSS